MQYDNTDVRRRDRLMPEEQVLRLLREGEYGYLSMADAGGEPYGLPISYVWDEAAGNVVYLHCAPEGRKLRVLAERPDVSFCVVGARRWCLSASPRPMRVWWPAPGPRWWRTTTSAGMPCS